VGAVLGQIHMSGFFLAGALWLWTLLFKRSSVAWKAWFFGSILGVLPLIPWLQYLIQHPVDHAVSVGWEEMVQLKYWVFWITDGIGLHLGNPLGVLRGNSHWDQLSDFVRYPLIQGHATYLTGVAHGLAVVSGEVGWGCGSRGEVEDFVSIRVIPHLYKTQFFLAVEYYSL
jgi:hypothetical protein